MSAYEFTHNGTRRRITVAVDNQDACCETLVEEFMGFLLAVGFHPDTVREYFWDDSQESPGRKALDELHQIDQDLARTPSAKPEP